jgi:hypothetical protein
MAEVVVTNTIPLSEAARQGAEDQGAFDRRADWTGDSVDSRRDFGQQTFYLERRSLFFGRSRLPLN